MNWECSECGAQVSRSRRPVVCGECGIGCLFVPADETEPMNARDQLATAWLRAGMERPSLPER